MRVTVLNDGSTAPKPVAAASVQVTGTSDVSATTTNGAGVAFFPSVPAGNATVAVTLAGKCELTQTISVIEGAETQVSFTACGDVVRATNAAGEEIVVVADVRNESGACEQDRVSSGIGYAKMTPSVLALAPGGTAPCHGGGGVFSKNHAPFYTDKSDAFPWSDGVDNISVTLPPRRLRVAVRFWIADAAANPKEIDAIETRISSALLWADDVLSNSKAGIELVKSERSAGPPPIVDVSSIAEAVRTIGTSCDNAASIRSKRSLYDDAAINVYYVPTVVPGIGGTPAGYNCVDHDAPNIIFIDDDNAHASTLVHEIGHGLGLSAPDWGHTNLMKDFRKNSTGELMNTMANTAVTANYFSIGQVIRMHIHATSWLNIQSGAAGSVRSRQATALGSTFTTACGCPDTATTPDCARLALDTPRAGDITTGISNLLACRVEAPPTITVLCGVNTPLTAKFFQGASLPAVADGSWRTSAPNVVKLSGGTSAVGSITTSLFGVSAGTSEIRAYGGGVYTTTIVTVLPACP